MPGNRKSEYPTTGFCLVSTASCRNSARAGWAKSIPPGAHALVAHLIEWQYERVLT
jgi:hypothetical protein